MEAAPLQSERIADLVAQAEQQARLKAARFGWDPLTGLPSTPSSQARRPGDLNVLVLKGGKTLFRSIDDDRVRVSWPGEPLTAAPDLVVTTRAAQLQEGPEALGLSPDVWRRLQTGASRLAIDASSEGKAHSAAHTAHLHGLLQSAGIAPSNCVYVTQDRGYRDQYLAHLRELGQDGAAMDVLVHDRFIQYLLAALRTGGQDQFDRQLRTYASAGRVRERRFLSLNNKLAYPQRALFLLRLLRDGLWSRGHISIGKLYEFDGRSVSPDQFQKRLRVLPELNGLLDEVLPLLGRLEALSPRYIGIGAEVSPRGGATKELIIPSMFEEYSSSWCSVVVETDFSGRLHRITEKPFKPLLCFHPLIVLGSCGSLRLIRNYGFETFPALFDESYDEATDARTRFEMVYEQVVRLCRLDEAELARCCDAAAGAVVFNAWWGLTQLPGLFRDRIDGALIDRLLAVVHGQAGACAPA